MKKLIAIIIFVLNSCRQAEQITKPLIVMPISEYKEAQPTTQDFLQVTYSKMLGVLSQSIMLQKQPIQLSLDSPTVIYCNDPYFVYPGDKIYFEIDSTGEITINVEGNIRKTQEAVILKEINRLLNNRSNVKDIDTGINESNFLQKFNTYSIDVIEKNNEETRLFDSISAKRKFNKKFTKRIKLYLNIESRKSLLSFYMLNDKLLNGQTKLQFYRNLKDSLNNFRNEELFNYGLGEYVIDVANNLLSDKIWNVSHIDELNITFDSIVAIFKNFSRDFLLTKLLFIAKENNIEIPKSIVIKYYKICKASPFRHFISLLEKQIETQNRLLAEKGSNALYTDKGNDATNIEEVFHSQRNRILLIDIWASWCVPCLKQLPYFDSLKKKFNAKDFNIINISIEKNINRWKYYLIRKNLTEHQYIFIKPQQSSFIRENQISVIPRVMLINYNGKIINNNVSLSDTAELARKITQMIADKYR